MVAGKSLMPEDAVEPLALITHRRSAEPHRRILPGHSNPLLSG